MKPQFQNREINARKHHSKRQSVISSSVAPQDPSTVSNQVHTLSIKTHPHEIRHYHSSMKYKSYVERELEEKIGNLEESLLKRRRVIIDAAAMRTPAQDAGAATAGTTVPEGAEPATMNADHTQKDHCASPLLQILRERKQQRNALSPSDATVLSFNNTEPNQCRTRIVYDLREMQIGNKKIAAKEEALKGGKKKRTKSAKRKQMTDRPEEIMDTEGNPVEITQQRDTTTQPLKTHSRSSTPNRKRRSKSASNKENTSNKPKSRRKSIKYTNIRMPPRPTPIEPLTSEAVRPLSANAVIPAQQRQKKAPTRKRRSSVSQKPVESKKIVLDTSARTPRNDAPPMMLLIPPAEEVTPQRSDNQARQHPTKPASSAKTEEISTPTRTSELKSIAVETDAELLMRLAAEARAATRESSTPPREKITMGTQTPSRKKRKHHAVVNHQHESEHHGSTPTEHPAVPRQMRQKKKRSSAQKSSRARATLENIRHAFSVSATPKSKRSVVGRRSSAKKSHHRRNSLASDLDAIPTEELKERPMYLDADSLHIAEHHDQQRSDMVASVPKVEIRSRPKRRSSSASGHATKSEIRALLLQSKNEMHNATSKGVEEAHPAAHDPTLSLKEKLKQSFERSRRIKESLWLQKYGDLLENEHEEQHGELDEDEEALLSASTREFINMTSPSRKSREHVQPSSVGSSDTSLNDSHSLPSPPRSATRILDLSDRSNGDKDQLDSSHASTTENNKAAETHSNLANDDRIFQSLLDSDDDTPLDELERTLEAQHQMLIHEGILSEDDE